MDEENLNSTDQSFKERIVNLLRHGSQTVDQFREQIQNRNLVILLGSTKSGKSTIINYLIGNSLEAFAPEYSGLKIREAGISHGPKIGRTSVSETSVPGVYQMHGIADTVIADSPGFDDNRGPEQNVINAIFINQVKHARSVRFVLVSDVSEVSNDNINIFLNVLRRMNELLSSCLEISPTVSIIVTKVPHSETQESISNLLRRQVVHPQFSSSTHLITNIVHNENLIGIFKIPLAEGPIGRHLDLNIRGAIGQSQVIRMDQHRIHLALSDEAKTNLLEVYMEYTNSRYFQAEVENVLRNFADYSRPQWIYASFDEELTETQRALESLKALVLVQLNTRRIRLSEIKASIETLLGTTTSQDFANHFEFIITLDNADLVEEPHKGNIEMSYTSTLRDLCDTIESLLRGIGQEANERSDQEIEFPSEKNLAVMSRCVAKGVLLKAKRLGSAVAGLAADAFNSAVQRIRDLTDSQMSSLLLALTALPMVEGTAVPEMAAGAPTMERVATAAEGILEKVAEQAPKALGIAGVVGVGAGGSAAFIVYQEIYGDRMQARRQQNRSVYSLM